MDKYVWIGKYESDVKNCNLFYKSITIFGSNKINNISYCEIQRKSNFIYNDFLNFVINVVNKNFISEKSIKLLFYNSQWAIDIIKKAPEFAELTILPCSNEALKFISGKLTSRLWISPIYSVPPFMTIAKQECNYEYLKKCFPEYSSFIIKELFSEGGDGTFIINKDKKFIETEKLKDFSYVASPNLENSLSLNSTIVCYKNDFLQFPISHQILDKNYKYQGSDYISGAEIYENYSDSIDEFINIVAKQLISVGYRGICGIDFIIHNDDIFFIEFNPRFQGSTYLLEYCLSKQKNASVFNFHIDAIQNKELSKQEKNISNITINYGYINESFLNNVNINDTKLIADGVQNIFRRYLINKKFAFEKYEILSNDYYNYFAEKYKFIIPDYDDMIKNEGEIIKNILNKYSSINTYEILDCTCGIGIQTISLAKQGYKVYGSDISENEIEVAKIDSKKHKLQITYNIADCRNLKVVYQNKLFDAIISIDSALPHLLNEDNFLKTFNSAYGQLKTGGIFLASFRDYDTMIKEKPLWAYPQRLKRLENMDIIVVRNFEWEDEICTSHQYYIEKEKNKEPHLYYNTYKQWAISKRKLFEIAKRSKFKKILWLTPKETGFYQPILCLKK